MLVKPVRRSLESSKISVLIAPKRKKRKIAFLPHVGLLNTFVLSKIWDISNI